MGVVKSVVPVLSTLMMYLKSEIGVSESTSTTSTFNSLVGAACTGDVNVPCETETTPASNAYRYEDAGGSPPPTTRADR